MIYGYARVSTKTQAKNGNYLEAQENALGAAGATEIYVDAFTGTKSRRPELDKLLAVMQPGDTLKVIKLDRIARSATQGIELTRSLLDKGVVVHVLNMGMMDNSPTGKLVRNVMSAFAEFERDMIVERIGEGKYFYLFLLIPQKSTREPSGLVLLLNLTKGFGVAWWIL